MDCPSGRRVGLGAVAGPGSPPASGALVQGDLTTQRQRRVITQPAGAADGACGDSLPLWAGVCLGAAPCWQHPAAPAMDLSSHVFPPVTQTLRSAALEDCALCQETLSSSELATKTRDGGLEGAWGAGDRAESGGLGFDLPALACWLHAGSAPAAETLPRSWRGVAPRGQQPQHLLRGSQRGLRPSKLRSLNTSAWGVWGRVLGARRCRAQGL